MQSKGLQENGLMSPITHNQTSFGSPSLSRSGYLPSRLFPLSNQEHDTSKEVQTPWNTKTKLTLEGSPVPRLDSSEKKEKEQALLPPLVTLYDNDSAFESHENPKQDLARASEEFSSMGSVELTTSQKMDKWEREELDDRWVTIFGFPKSKTEQIKEEFTRYGEIIKFKEGNGNWIDIQYRTSLQAQSALSKQGRLIEGDLMVGIRTGKEKKIKELSVLQKKSTNAVPNPSIFRAAAETYAIQSSLPSNAPLPSNSWWNKFQEYIIGL